MARKNKTKQTNSLTGKAEVKKSSSDNSVLFYAVLIFSFSFLLFANSIPNDYNLDDGLVTRNHHLTSQGIKAIPEIFTSPYYSDAMGYLYDYRPVVLTSFAIEHQLFGDNPHVSHFINVLLYALMCTLLFYILQSISGFSKVFSVCIALLFAAHPLHTEIVCNIKNRDEILSLLFAFVSWKSLQNYVKKGYVWLIPALLGFAIALMSKYSVAAFAIIIPITLIYFFKVPFRKLLISVVILDIPVFLFAQQYYLSQRVNFTLQMFSFPILAYWVSAPGAIGFGKNLIVRELHGLLGPARNVWNRIRSKWRLVSGFVMQYNWRNIPGFFGGAAKLELKNLFTVRSLLILLVQITPVLLWIFFAQKQWLFVAIFMPLVIFLFAPTEAEKAWAFIVSILLSIFLGYWCQVLYDLHFETAMLVIGAVSIGIMAYAGYSDKIRYPVAILLITLQATALYDLRLTETITISLILVAVFFWRECKAGAEFIVNKSYLRYFLLIVVLIKLVVDWYQMKDWFGGPGPSFVLILIFLPYLIKIRIARPLFFKILKIAGMVFVILFSLVMEIYPVISHKHNFEWVELIVYGCHWIAIGVIILWHYGKLKLDIGRTIIALCICLYGALGGMALSSNFMDLMHFKKLTTKTFSGNQQFALTVSGLHENSQKPALMLAQTPNESAEKPAFRFFKGNPDRKFEFIESPVKTGDPVQTKISFAALTVLHYLQKLIIPYPLSFYYGYRYIQPEPLLSPWPIISLLIHTILAFIVIYTFRSNSLLSWSMFIYLIGVVAVSNYFQTIAGIVGDRFAVVPSLGFCIALTLILFKTGKIKPANEVSGYRNFPTIFKAGFLLILLSYSLLTFIRNGLWKDELTLFRNDIRFVNMSAQAHNILASNLNIKAGASQNPDEQKALHREAVDHYKSSIQIYPPFFNATYDLARTYMALNERDSALLYFKKALPMDSTFSDILINIGEILALQNRYADAIPYYEQAIRTHPEDYNGYDRLSFLYYRIGENAKSIQTNRKAMEYMPKNSLPYINIGRMFMEMHQKDSALVYFRRASTFDSNNLTLINTIKQIEAEPRIDTLKR